MASVIKRKLISKILKLNLLIREESKLSSMWRHQISKKIMCAGMCLELLDIGSATLKVVHLVLLPVKVELIPKN